MPTHTPSPHRFLAPKSKATQKPKPNPQSSLRHGFSAHTPKPGPSLRQEHDSRLETPKATLARRFVIAPTRNGNSTQRTGKERADEAETDSHAQPTPLIKAQRKLKRVESIEEGSQESPSAFANADDGSRIARSVEQSSPPWPKDPDEKDEDGEILFISEQQSKRRRLTPQPQSSPSANHSRTAHVQEPQTPAPASHRFLPSAQKTPASFANISTSTPAQAAHSRPHFLLPPQPISPPKSANPLPETFSPSRKHQKYIPNGLASTLQSWIIETANMSYGNVNWGRGVVWGKDKEDGVQLRIRISDIQGGRSGADDKDGNQEVECFPGYVVFVKGDTDAGLYNASRASSAAYEAGEIKVLLVGQGGVRGSGGVKVRKGGIMGIRAPTWDIDVGDEKWMVGVDWVVL